MMQKYILIGNKDQETTRRLKESLETYVTWRGDAPYINIGATSDRHEFMKNITDAEHKPSIIVLGDGMIEDYVQLSQRIPINSNFILTYNPLEMVLAQKIAKEFPVRAVPLQPPTSESLGSVSAVSSLFYTSVYDALGSHGKITDLGIIGTGGFGSALAYGILGKYGIKSIILYNGGNVEKAEQLKMGLERRLQQENIQNLTIELASSVAEMKLHADLIAYTIGKKSKEIIETQKKGSVRQDFLTKYLPVALQHSKELVGFTGNLLDVTNPVSCILYALHAGSYKSADSFDAQRRFCIPEGLSMIDHDRAIHAMVELVREALKRDNDEASEMVNVKIVGPRDRPLIVDASYNDLSLTVFRQVARQRGIGQDRLNYYSYEGLTQRMYEMGVETIKKAGNYFTDEYMPALFKHFSALTGEEQRPFPSVTLVDLIQDSDFGNGGFYTLKRGRKKKMRAVYEENFPNGVITAWESSRQDRLVMNEKINAKEQCRTLLSRLLEERQLLLNALSSDSIGSDLKEQADKVKRFFHEKLS